MYKNRTYSGVVDPTGDVAVREAKSPTAPPSRDWTRDGQEDEPPRPQPQEPTLDQQPCQEMKVETPSRARQARGNLNQKRGTIPARLLPGFPERKRSSCKQRKVNERSIVNPRRACAARVTAVGSVCVCVCYSTSHLSNVCSSQKRYHLPNGQ